MRKWSLLLGGLIVWAAHFFLLYAVASIFPGDDMARWLTIAATIPALAANVAILWLASVARVDRQPDELDRWILDVGAGGSVLSLVAVVWQALPAIA